MHIHSMDVATAFLYGDNPETTYMKLPPGLNSVCINSTNKQEYIQYKDLIYYILVQV